MTEQYTAVFSSSSSVNQTYIIGTLPVGRAWISYNVNWPLIIPEKYKLSKFRVRFSFNCNIRSGYGVLMPCIIYLDGINFIDSLQNDSKQANFLGCISPKTMYNWTAKANENCIRMCSYPNSNSITVRIFDISTNQYLSNQPLTNYILTLSFEPSETDVYTLPLFSGLNNTNSILSFSPILWSSIIPEKYRQKMFRLRFSFYSQNVTSNNNEPIALLVSGFNGTNTSYVGNGNILGMIPYYNYQQTTTGTFHSGTKDNVEIIVSYPYDGSIIVTLNNANISTLSAGPPSSFVLILSLEPIQ